MQVDHYAAEDSGPIRHGNDAELKEKRFAASSTDSVDLEEAASLRPTKLRGKALTWMVTFVAGTGFTLFGYGQSMTVVPADKQTKESCLVS